MSDGKVVDVIGIADLALKTYSKLPSGCKPGEHEWIPFAAVIREDPMNGLTCVALATGSKAISAQVISLNPDIVHDCHAEVLARRGYERYMLKNRLTAEKGKIHMYISHIPCGSCAIQEKPGLGGACLLFDEDDSEWWRTGAKPVPAFPALRHDEYVSHETMQDRKVLRLKPGKGEPSLSHCCSDKIMKWAFCGFAGSLLKAANCAEDAFSSIVVAHDGPGTPDGLEAAISGRLLASSLSVANAPRIILITHGSHPALMFPYSKYRARGVRPSFLCVSWVLHEGHEVLVEGYRQGVSKKHITRGLGTSRLARPSLLNLVFQMRPDFARQDGESHEDTKRRLLDIYAPSQLEILDTFFQAFPTWCRGHQLSDSLSASLERETLLC